MKTHLLVVYAFYISNCSSLVLVTCKVLYHRVCQPTASLIHHGHQTDRTLLKQTKYATRP